MTFIHTQPFHCLLSSSPGSAGGSRIQTDLWRLLDRYFLVFFTARHSSRHEVNSVKTPKTIPTHRVTTLHALLNSLRFPSLSAALIPMLQLHHILGQAYCHYTAIILTVQMQAKMHYLNTVTKHG